MYYSCLHHLFQDLMNSKENVVNFLQTTMSGFFHIQNIWKMLLKFCDLPFERVEYSVGKMGKKNRKC